jgi:hypothetical protein
MNGMEDDKLRVEEIMKKILLLVMKVLAVTT